MWTHQKFDGTAALKITFTSKSGGLASNARPNLLREILFGVTEGNTECDSRLKVKRIHVSGEGLPVVFRRLAKEIVKETVTRENTPWSWAEKQGA